MKNNLKLPKPHKLVVNFGGMSQEIKGMTRETVMQLMQIKTLPAGDVYVDGKLAGRVVASFIDAEEGN